MTVMWPFIIPWCTQSSFNPTSVSHWFSSPWSLLVCMLYSAVSWCCGCAVFSNDLEIPHSVHLFKSSRWPMMLPLTIISVPPKKTQIPHTHIVTTVWGCFWLCNYFLYIQFISSVLKILSVHKCPYLNLIKFKVINSCFVFILIIVLQDQSWCLGVITYLPSKFYTYVLCVVTLKIWSIFDVDEVW
jgi:hypothetical protein